MTMTRTGRLVGSVALAAALALGTAACNDDDVPPTDSGQSSDSGDTPVDPAEAVSASLKQLEGTSYTMDISMGDFGGGTFEVDLANKVQHGTLDLDFSSMAGSAGTPMSMMSMEMIIIDTDMWMKIDGLNDKWMHTTVDSVTDDQMSGMDMSQMTQEMLDTLDNVTMTGDNTYTATINVDSLAGTLGAESEGTGVEPFDVTIVLNDDGLVQSMSFEVPMPDGTTLPMSMEITDYDMPVNVTPPADSEVTELGDLG